MVCILFSFSVFSQQKYSVGKDSIVEIPSSIFAVNSLTDQQNNEQPSPLRLTGYKFLYADYSQHGILSGNIHLDIRNFGRHASYDDISDNYNKANFYKFAVSKNTNHFIWTMWDTRLQKQWQNSREFSKN